MFQRVQFNKESRGYYMTQIHLLSIGNQCIKPNEDVIKNDTYLALEPFRTLLLRLQQNIIKLSRKPGVPPND